MLARLIKRLRQERGFTLIEMMIVVTILGFLATVSATLVSILFTANLRSTQLGSQQTTIENTFGFLSSRIALVQYGDLGVTDGGTGINPLTLAGDQILFTSSFKTDSAVSNEEICFRLSYLAEIGEIRVASKGGSCTASGNEDILPKRGPNAYLWDGGSEFRMPGQSGFDPVIDSAYVDVQNKCKESGLSGSEAADCQDLADVRAFALASGVENYNPINSGWENIPSNLRDVLPTDLNGNGKDFLPPFAFTDRGGSLLEWYSGGSPTSFKPLPVAGVSGTSSSSYPLASIVVGSLGGVDVRALIAPVSRASTADSSVSPRFYQQDYSLQQLCAIWEASTQAGGDLTGSYPNPTIAPGAVSWEQFSSQDSDPAFPYDKKESFAGVTLAGGEEYTDLLTYAPSDVPSGKDMPSGRYLAVGSVLGSTVLSNNSATSVELSLAYKVGATTSLVASDAGSSWPLVVSGVIDELRPDQDTVYLRARAKQETAVPTQNPDRPIRLELYWLGP